jgi:uncharacterized membrane protein (DUF106 family)
MGLGLVLTSKNINQKNEDLWQIQFGLMQLRLFRTFKCDMKVILLLYMIVFLWLADVQPKSGVYTVGDFMTRKEDLHVVKPTTTVDEGIC